MIRGMFALLLWCLFSALFGCGAQQVVPLQATPAAGQAHGRVQVERIEGDARLYTLVLHDLPKPQEIQPMATNFVAWMILPDGAPRLVGAMEYLENKHRALIMVTSSAPAFEVRVTLERASRPDAPSETVLFHQSLVSE